MDEQLSRLRTALYLGNWAEAAEIRHGFPMFSDIGIVAAEVFEDYERDLLGPLFANLASYSSGNQAIFLLLLERKDPRLTNWFRWKKRTELVLSAKRTCSPYTNVRGQSRVVLYSCRVDSRRRSNQYKKGKRVRLGPAFKATNLLGTDTYPEALALCEMFSKQTQIPICDNIREGITLAWWHKKSPRPLE